MIIIHRKLWNIKINEILENINKVVENQLVENLLFTIKRTRVEIKIMTECVIECGDVSLLIEIFL